MSDLPPPPPLYVEENNVFPDLLNVGGLARGVVGHYRGPPCDKAADSAAHVHGTADAPDLYDMLDDRVPWDVSFARAVAQSAGTAGVWEGWERVSAAALDARGDGSRCLAPVVDADTDTTPPLSSLRDLFRLVCLRARLLASDGDADLAVRQLADCLLVSRRMAEAEGGMLYHLTMNSLSRTVLRHLHRIAVEYPVSQDVLRMAIECVSNSRPGKDSFLAAMTADLRWWNAKLSHVVDDPGHVFPDSQNRPLPRILWWPVRIFVKPNATLGMQARYFRRIAPLVDCDYPVLQSADLNALAAQIAQIDDWRRFNPWNMMGRYMTGLSVDESLLRGRLEHQSHVSAIEAVLALRLHEQEVVAGGLGALPESLDALVPGYLPAVPRDYFDGLPIKYSREHRRVWSLGTDNYNPTAVEGEERKQSRRDIMLNLGERR